MTLLPSAWALAACGGGGGDDPAFDPGAASRVLLDDAGGLLGSAGASALALAEQTLNAVMGQIAASAVVVTLKVDAANAIAGWGLGGRTFSAGRVEIYIDPTLPALGTEIAAKLPALLAHELHHAVRWRRVGYGSTLFEAMISEGLADHFAVRLLGVPLAPWSDAFGEADTTRYLDLARPEFDSASYSHPRWFFDAGLPTLPRWTGYTLGWRLVRTYLATHASSTAASLVDTAASAFRP